MKINPPSGTYISIGGDDRKLFNPMIAPLSVGLTPESYVLNTNMTINQHYSSLNLNASINQTANGKNMFGIANYLISGGTYTGANIFGIYSFLQHAHVTGGATARLKGLNAQVDVGSDAQDAFGAFISVAKGNENSVATLYGAHVVCTSGYSPVTVATSLLAELRSASQATTITEGKVLQVKWRSLSGAHTWETLKFISLDESSKDVATVNLSYGIYADTSIDVGTEKWFIYSLSASPSRLVGDLRLNSGFRLETESTPASAGATGTKGDIKWDSSFVYVCVATNTWKRAAISTW